MTLFTRENCQQCENVKKYIGSVGLKNIEIKELSEEAREILINQGAKTMPLLVENDKLLAQGNKVLDYLIKLKLEDKENKNEKTFNGMTYPYLISDNKIGTTILCDLTVCPEKLTEEEKNDLKSEMKRFVEYFKNRKEK